jgi:DNA-binding NtrC family response regulator
LAYAWPGNVGKLENCIERCCAINSGPVIHPAYLPISILGASAQLANESAEARIVPVADLENRAVLRAIAQLNGDKLMAAKMLGFGKTTLYRKLKAYVNNQVVVPR